MNFKIEDLDRNTSGGVTRAHWTVSKTSGGHTVSRYGDVTFIPDSTVDGYIFYDSLTEANVLAWVQDALDTNKLEAYLDADLAELTSPSILTGKPW